MGFCGPGNGDSEEKQVAVMMCADSDIKLNQSLLRKQNRESKAEKAAKKEMRDPS